MKRDAGLQTPGWAEVPVPEGLMTLPTPFKTKRKIRPRQGSHLGFAGASGEGSATAVEPFCNPRSGFARPDDPSAAQKRLCRHHQDDQITDGTVPHCRWMRRIICASSACASARRRWETPWPHLADLVRSQGLQDYRLHWRYRPHGLRGFGPSVLCFARQSNAKAKTASKCLMTARAGPICQIGMKNLRIFRRSPPGLQSIHDILSGSKNPPTNCYTMLIYQASCFCPMPAFRQDSTVSGGESDDRDATPDGRAGALGWRFRGFRSPCPGHGRAIHRRG